MQSGVEHARGPVMPPRLLTSLDKLLRGRIAVVSGPAGHGKHELVRVWLESHPELIAHEQSVADDLPAVRSLLNSRDGNQLIVVVVDRPELLRDRAFVANVLELAERQPRIRMIFVGRSRPDAPLGSLAARGLLIDLDGNQLAWTRPEVAAALKTNNPEMPETGLDTIMTNILGWPAIARMLAAEPLTWAHSSKISRLADSYIQEEVLSGLSPEDVRLLQELSALPSLDPLAASWMTGRADAAAQLSRLQSHGVPITWDDGNTIRINPMLRAHLNRMLARERPEASQELNQRAALWLRNRGRSVEAIGLAMQVGMVDLAWMLAGEFITVHMGRPEMVQTIPGLIEILPPGWELDTVRSVSRGLATPQTMIAQLDAIDAQQMISRNDTGRLGYATFVLGMVRQVGYPAEVDLSLALEVAAKADPRALHELDLALLSTARLELGLWQLHHGLLESANDTLLGALGIARVINVPWVIVTSLSALSFIHAHQGSVAPAQRLADEAILTLNDTVFTTDALDELALVALATTAVDTGDLVSAGRWIDQLDRHADHPVENDALRTTVRAMLATAKKEPDTALGLVVAFRDQPRPQASAFHDLLVAVAAYDAATALDDQPAMKAGYQRIAEVDLPPEVSARVVHEARLALSTGDPHKAYRLLKPLSEQRHQPFTHAKNTLYMLMIFGVAADELHHADEALQAFQRAGVLAERLGLDTTGARHTNVAAASRKEVPLTEAERHALTRLDSSKTLGETAEELFISPNTLKTHLRRIYRKLGVANREQALERARMMGLRDSD